MVAVEIVYEGTLRCKALHEPSGASFVTDAPRDNHGKGESFSPTDLMATALGSCILTVMGLAANTLGVNLQGAHVRVEKTMQTTPVRRIIRLAATVNVPMKLDEKTRAALQHAAEHCPVHKSLHPDIDAPIIFHWA